MPATVQTLIDDTQHRCPGCLHRVVSRYKLDTDPDEDALCGDCFADSLATGNARIHLD